MADQNFRVKNGLSVGIGGTVITTLSSGNVGLGTTNPTSKLWVNGDGYFVGVLTANRIFSSTYGEFVGGSISGTNLVGTALSISGISTSSEFVGGGSDLRNISGTHLVSYASHSETSNSALSIAGISTYTQVGILTGSFAVDSNDNFGNSVASSADGKTIIVGALNDEIGATTTTGIAYVFDRIGNSFNQVGILTGSFAVNSGDQFGKAVATSADGKTIIVGVPNDEIGATASTGIAYVFDRIGNSFNQVGILTGSLASDNFDSFGEAVATSADGKTIIVGAPIDEIGATTTTGIVYVFDRIGNSFNQVGILTGSFAVNNFDSFGNSVSTSADGKTIIVGASGDENTGSDRGLVYVFDRIGNSFNQVGILTGSLAVNDFDNFGQAVATSADGKTIIVGATGDEIGATTSTGVVYVFDRIGSSFNQVGILTGSYADSSFDFFGRAVATSADGKTIIVGAFNDEIGATAGTGIVYVFKRQGNSFNQVGILTGSFAVDSDDNFGQAVATSADGKTIIVGAYNDEIGATTGTGIAYVFDEVKDTYVYSGPTGNIGIGTTNPTSKLWVQGDGYFTGVVTANKFVGTIDATSASTLNVAFASTAGIATYTSEWILGAVGSSDYTFTGPGFTGAVSDPTLYLSRGQQYKFTNTMSAHPFRIQNIPGLIGITTYNDGIVNNGVSNGTLTWNVQFNAPNLLYYQCTAHGSMGGKIYIIDAGIGTDVSINTTGIITANSFRGDGSQLTGITATANVSISTNTDNKSQYLTYVTGTGSTNGFGVTTTGLLFNPNRGYLGIGTNTLSTTLNIGGVIRFTNNNIRIGDSSTGSLTTSGIHNFFAGSCAGLANTSGSYNNFFGQGAGCCNTSGCNNNFLGTYAGRSNTSGSYNNFFGRNAGRYNTSGSGNNFIGPFTGCRNTTGCRNNFLGHQAGQCNTTGSYNNFFGDSAGCNNTGSANNFLGRWTGLNNTGSCNNFLGHFAGYSNTSGGCNNFFGPYAGYCNTTGCANNFLGNDAGRYNTTGCNNNFLGLCAGRANTTGFSNNFFGPNAGLCNTEGCYNNFFGNQAGLRNTTGSSNNFLGYWAGRCNTTGSANNFIGQWAGCYNTTGCNNNFFGRGSGRSNTTGNNNNYLGYYAGRYNTYGSNNNFLGCCAGRCNTSGAYNNFFGSCAGRYNTTGCHNNILGTFSGPNNTTGRHNNFFGYNVAESNTTGSYNNFFGHRSGLQNNGCHNNFFGKASGLLIASGCYNNFFGYCSASSQQSGNNNIAIGYNVQLPDIFGSDQLNIGSGSNSWITGNSNFNIGLGTANPTSKLWVLGDGYFTGVVTATNFYVGTQLVGGSISGTDLVGTALSISGISTLGTVQISSGIITATTGVVTYYGDGSKLTGITATANVSISTNTDNKSQYLTYVTGTGSTNGFGVTTTALVFNPSTKRLGIGTDTLTTTLNIGGTLGFSNNNIKIGDANTGCSITSGTHNFFAGSEAGKCNTTGCKNNFLGNIAGRNNTTGDGNNFIGLGAGFENTTGRCNNFFGYWAGLNNISGCYNNFFGYKAGYGTVGSILSVSVVSFTTGPIFGSYYGIPATGGSGSGVSLYVYRNNVGGIQFVNILNGGSGYQVGNTLVIDGANVGGVSGTDNITVTVSSIGSTGSCNNFIGFRAGECNTTGAQNNFFGAYAGQCNVSGSCNNFFGRSAGRNNISGVCNNFFGTYAGPSNTTGANNNFMGEQSGSNNTTGSCNNFFGQCSGGNNISGCFNNFFGNSAGYTNTTGCFNNFIGTCAGFANTSGKYNNFFGRNAGYANTTGGSNNFFGRCAGVCNTTGCYNNFFGNCAGGSNTTGSENNFFGTYAGRCNTTGTLNNFFGSSAGAYNTTGCYNNFFGRQAGRRNTTGGSNNFLGNFSGRYNTTGCNNNFLGFKGGYCNTTGSYNNFFGCYAGRKNTTGSNNNYLGYYAGCFNTTGSNNNFFGDSAGRSNTTASFNNFFGKYAGRYNTSGSYNNFFGCRAGFCNTNGSDNNYFGQNAGNCNTTGCYNNFFGSNAGCTQTSGNNNIAIGYNVQLPILTGSDQLIIGSGSNSWITGNSNFNVGIGTTNPTAKLQVVTTSSNGAVTAWGSGQLVLSPGGTPTSQGLGFSVDTSTGSASLMSLSPSITWNPMYYRAGSHIFMGSSGSNELARFDTSGNLLINTTTSTGTASQPLQVTGGAYVSGNLGVGVTNPVTNLEVSGNSPTLRISGTSGSTARLDLSSTGAIKWSLVGNPLGSNGALTIQSNDIELIRVSNNTGNLGIGVTAPAFKADIAGDARVQSTGKMRFGGTAGASNFYIQYNSTTNSLDFVAG